MSLLKHSEDDLCVNVLLTSTCNAGCSWCIADDFMKNQHASKKMSEGSMEILLKKLEQEKLLQVNLLGGEPSLHPQALDFGESVHNLGIPVGFSTNALWPNSFREKFSNINYPLEAEITYLGKHAYSEEKLKKIIKTFEQLKGHPTSVGLILDTPQTRFEEHLDLAEEYGFQLRWAIVEPTIKSGLTKGYQSLENVQGISKRAIEIVKEANKRGIKTWADLTVPKCAIPKEDLYIFEGTQNDIQFKCPPFFDISPDLKIWRCLPLAGNDLSSLLEFDSFKQAYRHLNKVKIPYLDKGVFDECKSCEYLTDACSGGTSIAKILKHGN
ncbi:MAG: radical SAM protein [archaeon]